MLVEEAMEEIDKMNDNSQDQMSFTKKLKDKIAQLVSVTCNFWIRSAWVPVDWKGADVMPVSRTDPMS